MPIVSINAANPFVDGRQSDRALAIRKGVERHFEELGWTTLPELTLKSGRRADLVALSAKGELIIVEIKSSVADFRADNKWPDYDNYCDFLYFATLCDVPEDIFPQTEGLIIADSYGAEILRPAVERKLSAPRRKLMIATFARTAAQRLARCCAHAGLENDAELDSVTVTR